MLLVGLWCMSTAGLQYSFGTYSQVVQDKLGLTQTQLTVLALGKDCGAYLSVYTGLFYDRFGSRRTLLLGVRPAPMHPNAASSRATQGLLMLLGYLGLYALVGMGPGKHPGARCAPGAACTAHA